MALFEKKFCDICGNKIGVLGNRKLEDGNLCKDCASLLSPFFSERRRSTVEDIKAHLAYREANKAAVSAFRATRTLGLGTKVMLDEDAGKFLVTAARRLEDANPDVLDFSQVTGASYMVDENKSEVTQRGADGKSVSYSPPRYKYSYAFKMNIQVNHPWFNEISFQLNDRSIEVENTFGGGGAAVGRRNSDYTRTEQAGNEITEALTRARQGVRDNIAAANAPKIAQTCPLCGATTMPDASGRCEYCGGAMA